MQTRRTIVLLPLAVLLLAGCSGDRIGARPRIAVVVKALDSEFWLEVKKGVEAAAEAHPELEVSIMAPQREIDIDQQVALLENQIARKVDAIVLSPSGVSQVIPALDRARAAGIPVVILDTDVPWTGKLTYVGSDNRLGGRLAGEFMVKRLGGRGRVAVLGGVPGVETAEARSSGFREAVAAAPGIQIVAEQPANFDRSLAMTVMENILTVNSQLDGIFAANDQMALGALEALSARGRAEKTVIIGFDALSEIRGHIRAGRIHAAVAQRPFEMGRQAVAAAAKAIRGESVEPVLDTGTVLITAENVDQK